ncbi:MAG: amino acid permease [Telmatospirillum sp.]|nr:amino acid permease [Telmatospirillum sp.]
MDLFRTKSITALKEEMGKHALRRSLGAWDVVLMGIGVIIGTGIFVLTGVAAAKYAGPGIMLSFVFSSLACVFVCLAYSELASTIPAAGSAYTYTYTAAGEFIAWLVGWNLVLEYSVGASAVAGGWSAYLVGILKSGGIELPRAITAVPHDGGIVNLPAVLIVAFITLLLVRGVKESAAANRVLVAVKLGAIFLFLLLAGPKVDVTNWTPFLPYGVSGISAGAAIIFFAYLGVDSLATSAEETRNPQRDMPLGIILSLIICTVLYVGVSAVLTGVVPFAELNTAEPVTYALRKIGYNFGSAVIGVGAISGLTTVCLVMIYAQTRAFFAMSRDGLIPEWLCKVHPKYGTPHIITIIVGITVALISGFTPIGLVAEMCNIGTLFAFVVATTCVIILRKTQPDLERPFRCPAVWVVVPLAVLSCLYIMFSLPAATWIRFIAWSVLGTIIYAFYGSRSSRLNRNAVPASTV